MWTTNKITFFQRLLYLDRTQLVLDFTSWMVISCLLRLFTLKVFVFVGPSSLKLMHVHSETSFWVLANRPFLLLKKRVKKSKHREWRVPRESLRNGIRELFISKKTASIATCPFVRTRIFQGICQEKEILDEDFQTHHVRFSGGMIEISSCFMPDMHWTIDYRYRWVNHVPLCQWSIGNRRSCVWKYELRNNESCIHAIRSLDRMPNLRECIEIAVMDQREAAGKTVHC